MASPRDRATSQPSKSPGRVVLVHGIATPRWALRPLALQLSRYGYEVEPWHYRSLHHKIEYHAARLRDHLENLEIEGRTTYLVAHSMGCIVSGTAMAIGAQRAIRRMVWLAPPIYGSPIATVLSPWLGWAIPPIRQLIASNDDRMTLPVLQSLPETGIIAGSLDGIVPSRRTRYALATSHLTMNTSHNLLLLSPSVVKEIHSFLEKGCFSERSSNC